jgi:hypothetical protein
MSRPPVTESLFDRIHARVSSLRVPTFVWALAAAALPAGAVMAALSLSGATSPRFFPSPPPPPSPWIVARTEGNAPFRCQIAAVVLDETRAIAPREGVTLRLTRVTQQGTAEVWTALSDDKGAHRFADLPAGDYQLTALVDDRAPASSPSFHCDEDAERAFFELPLRPSNHVFEGKVVSTDGMPAAGAEIAVAQEDDEKSALAGTARVPVNPDGTFSFRMAPGRYTLLVQAPLHAPLVRKLSFDESAPKSTARFALVPAPRVTGRVVDENGQPVAGALVAAGGAFDPKARASTVRTEADGTFALPVVQGQDVVVTARGSTKEGTGVVARALLGVVTSRIGMTDVELVAHAGRDVEGVVLKPDGTPWAFGAVRYRVRELGLTGVEKADAEGRFVVAGMPLDAEVEVWAEGNATGAWGAQVSSPGTHDLLALTYVPAAY